MLLAVKLVVSLGMRDWIVVQGSFWVLALLFLDLDVGYMDMLHL